MNVPIYIVSGFGLSGAYLMNCPLILLANKSISAFKHKYPNYRLKNFDWGIHSVLT